MLDKLDRIDLKILAQLQKSGRITNVELADAVGLSPSPCLTRVKRLESDGRNAFGEYFVAEAAVALKQGAGRLIRSETDRGLLVVCDPRMAQMQYGKRLRNALPPMGWLGSEEEALSWLNELAAEHEAAW